MARGITGGRRAGLAAVRHWARARGASTLARAGYELHRVAGDGEPGRRSPHPASLPPDAAAALRHDNPRLSELRAAYAASTIPASVPTQWNERFLQRNVALQTFRSDNAYVWQQRKFQSSYRLRLYLTLLDIEARDRLGLLARLVEDGLLGALTETFGDRAAVSRDLLDSVNEINYLDSQMGLTSRNALRVLDIGAGYGRLAHRLSAATGNLETYDCADAVAVSTFLCEFYTRFRGVPNSVRTIALPQVETSLLDRYDLAVNIHSFSECSRAASTWWLDRIAERDVEWLLIIPNTAGRLLSMESDGSQQDFAPDVLTAGYELVDNRPVHQNDELRELIGVTDMFFLFRRSDRRRGSHGRL